MTALPESPVREYAKRIAGLMKIKRSPGAPMIYAGSHVAWTAGYHAGLDDAVSIVAAAASLGETTTRFEYRAIANSANGQWRATVTQAQGDMEAFRRTGSFEDLRVERRTVTVTEPVRLDAGEEPIL